MSTFESEVALIGCAMIEPDAVSEAFERLRPEYFSDPFLGRVWEHVRERRGLADPTLLEQRFGREAAWSDYGGMQLFGNAIADATTWTLPAHLEAIIDGAMRRGLSSVARDISERAKNQPGEGANLLAELEQAAAQIAREHVAKAQGVPAGLGALDMLDTAYSGGFAGSSVGLETIDRVTGGIRQDDVWFVGGRTSMGKSVAAICLGRSIAEQGRGVMMFSLEMPMREVQARLISDIAFDRRIPENTHEGGNVRYGDILKGRGTQGQQERSRAAARKLASLPFVINDQGGLSIEDIRAQALRQIRAWEKSGVPAGAVLIDHIGLVKAAGGRRSDNKAAETADIVNELKGMAKQLRAPIIALTQVNRNTESRNDKRPTLADLNWSGAIEQIADFICLLYRDAYYLERSSSEDDQIAAVRAKYDIELLIQKNRSGPICSLKAFADVACNAIRDIEPDQGRGIRVSVTAETIRLLVEAGLSGEQLVAVVESMERAPQKPERSKGAERQARYEERKRQKSVSSDVTPDASVLTSETPSLSPLSPRPPITTNPPPSPPIVPPSPNLAAFAEQIWLLQPLPGGKRRSTRPDVLKALKAVDRRGADLSHVLASCQAYYRLPDCRKDDGQFAKGAAVLLAEDRWREYEPGPPRRQTAQLEPVTPEIQAQRARHYRDTGEWREAWGRKPEEIAA